MAVELKCPECSSTNLQEMNNSDVHNNAVEHIKCLNCKHRVYENLKPLKLKRINDQIYPIQREDAEKEDMSSAYEKTEETNTLVLGTLVLYKYYIYIFCGIILLAFLLVILYSLFDSLLN